MYDRPTSFPVYDSNSDICVFFTDYRISLSFAKQLRPKVNLIPTQHWDMNFAYARVGVDRKPTNHCCRAPCLPFDNGGSIGLSHLNSTAYSRQFPAHLIETIVANQSSSEARNSRILHWRAPVYEHPVTRNWTPAAPHVQIQIQLRIHSIIRPLSNLNGSHVDVIYLTGDDDEFNSYFIAQSVEVKKVHKQYNDDRELTHRLRSPSRQSSRPEAHQSKSTTENTLRAAHPQLDSPRHETRIPQCENTLTPKALRPQLHAHNPIHPKLKSPNSTTRNQNPRAPSHPRTHSWKPTPKNTLTPTAGGPQLHAHNSSQEPENALMPTDNSIARCTQLYPTTGERPHA
ncbi:hypothetical protein G7Z17_g9001 [Cylindrodendrum hubeiense]|uniref:Uncharacterized protein n=1 Tax=Cylindrodendrum hubeiense TaxID=595255 RepID=A0A9P5H0A2_9HYPO|nr:hypothetical protein G7Z17_g9001 [Cylindrodendrum hubeiense]